MFTDASPSRRRTRRILMGVVVAATLVLTACGGSTTANNSSGSATSGSSGGGDGTVNIGTVSYPSSLDPSVSSSGFDYPHLNLIYDRLLHSDPTSGDLTPGLATAWKVSTDGLTITLTIRSGVTFQDGTPVDGAAVKASIDRYKASANGTDVATLEGVSLPDPMTVVIKLNAPDSSMVTKLGDRAGMIVSPTAVKNEGTNFAAKPVGAGKYSLTSAQTGSALVYSRFDKYWEGPAAVKTLDWKVFQTSQAMVTGFQSGAVDVAIAVPPTNVATLKAVAGKSVVVGPAYSETMINFNAGLAPTNNEKIRQAINMALDRDAINKAGTGDVAKVTWTALPPTHPYYDASIAPTYTFDSTKAAALVKEVSGGARISMKCLTFPGLNYETTGPIIIDELKTIGIDVTIESQAAAAATTAFWTKGAAPCFLSGWTGHADPAVTYDRLLGTKSFYNAGKVDFGITPLLNKLRATYDIPARKVVANDIAKAVVTTAPFAPLYTVPMIVGLSDKVSGYVPNASGRPDTSTLTVK